MADVLVSDGLGGPDVIQVPRNYGYVRGGNGRIVIAGSSPALYRDAVPLAVGALPGKATVDVVDIIDTLAPARPRVQSGTLSVLEGGGSCFEDTTRSLTLVLAAEPADDHTAPRDLTYAIFAGPTRVAAETASSPVAVRIAESPATVYFRDAAPDARWFAVAAIDLAGNVGPRSDAFEVEVHEEGGGCDRERSRPRLASVWRCSRTVGNAGLRGALVAALDSAPEADVFSRR